MATRTVGNNKRGAYGTWNDVENEDPNKTLFFEAIFPLQQFTLAYPIHSNVRAYYYKYNDGEGSEDAYPVFYLDNNGVPGEKLSVNEPLLQTGFGSGDTEGWVSGEVTLKRTVYSGTKIWFGFYGVFLCPRYDTGSSHVSSADYDGNMPPEILSYFWLRDEMPKMNLSMYFTYSDAPLSVNYTRGIQDSLGVLSSAFRSKGSNRKIVSSVRLNESMQRDFSIKRRIESFIKASTTTARHKGIRARVQSLIAIIEHVRCSRGLIRFVQTTLGLWERVATKIGVHKIVHNFYTPIALVIELKENVLIKKIYKGQSALRMSMDCDVDLTGALQTEIVANKPDGTLVVLPAFILDADKGKIAYDVTDSSVLNISGWWRFTPLVTFADDRSAPGVGVDVFVYEN